MERLAGRNLRKQSFRGCDLHDADLHGCDLRGADFTGADLRGANLQGVRTGLGRGPMISLAVAAIAISIGFGVLSAWAGDQVHDLNTLGGRYRASGLVVLVELALFLGVALWRGMRPAMLIVAPAVIAVAVILGILAIITGVGTGSGAAASVLLILAFTVIVNISTLARAVAGGLAPVMLVVAAFSGMLASHGAGGGIAAVAVAMTSVIMSRRALRGDPRYPWLRRMALTVTCVGGTRFRDADLRGAHLDGAHLRGSDFRGANLTGATWAGSKDRQLCRDDA